MDYKKRMRKNVIEKKMKALHDKRGPYMDADKNKEYSDAAEAEEAQDYAMETSSPSEYLEKYKRKKKGSALGRILRSLSE